MKIKNIDNNIILSELSDFNLTHIFDCGQCFRFNKLCDNTYFGIAFGRALKISQVNNEVTLHNTSMDDFNNIWFNFFDLSCDYGEIKKVLSSNDEKMRTAIAAGDGIRILKQDLWETMISFIISASNNIPRIKKIIESFCLNFGNEIEYEGKKYYTFPSPEKTASITDISVIKAGFRDKYILDAAKKFTAGVFNNIYELPTPEAKKLLMTVNGIGNKVSDCILLFGLNRTDSFPVDVWIKRIIEYCYLGEEVSINEISSFAKKKFSSIGGYAQQYLFYWARENKIGVQ